MGKRLKLIAGCLFFGLMFVQAVANVHGTWREKRTLSERGWEASEKEGKALIYRIDDAQLKSLLRVGDEVLEVKGLPSDTFRLLNRSESRVPPGTPYTLVIRRDGAKQELALRTNAESSLEWWLDWVVIGSNFVFILVGFGVLLLRPSDKQAILLALMLGAFSGQIQNSYLSLPGPVLALVLLARLIGPVLYPLFFHFFLLFPDRLSWVRRFPRLEYWLYVPYALIIFPLMSFVTAAFLIGRRDLLSRIPAPLDASANWLITGYMIAGLLALALNYRAADELARRRLRVVLAGSGLGFLNLLLIFLARFSGLASRIPTLIDYLAIPLALTLPLIPLSFAYAIARHQVIPVSLILRRGVRYLLVSRGSILIEGIAVTVAVTALLTLGNHPRKLFSVSCAPVMHGRKAARRMMM